ncbi:MAG: YSIRK-type signal peptide-containing protein [Streptococcus sp.]
MDSKVNSKSNTVAPKQAEAKRCYSIRKVATVGATSALVGTLAFLVPPGKS